MEISLTEWVEQYKQEEFGQIVITLIQLTAPFGGYKQSGMGRETHKMMLNHYRQNKIYTCLIVRRN